MVPPARPLFALEQTMDPQTLPAEALALYTRIK